MNRDKLLSIAIVSIAFVSGFLFFYNTEKWSLFYYPEGCLGCVEDWVIEVDAYTSKEACFAAARNMQNQNPARGDLFECGNQCKPVGEVWEGGQSYSCDSTFD